MAFAPADDTVGFVQKISTGTIEPVDFSTSPYYATIKSAIANLEEAGLGDVLYTPNSKAEDYNGRVDSYWSLTPRLRPWAIVQPRNTAEVSKAVQAIVKTEGLEFAIRSGGHTCYAGSNNIENGVTIDLGLMDRTEYDPETKLATLQPGGRWTKVYSDLEAQGVMVAGGREGLVGVGGLLTGGGKTYYTCRVGFACDQVVKYEVVLADGSIVEASEEKNEDLFRVLKGGSNNFGIVTKFHMNTFPAKDVWDGIVTYPPTSEPAIVDAFIQFTKQLHEKPDAHILAMWVSMPQMFFEMMAGIKPDPSQPPKMEMQSVINMIMTDLDGVENSKTLDMFTSLPNQVSSTMRKVSVAKKVADFLLPSNRQDIWFSLTYKLDKRIIDKTMEVYKRLVKEVQQHDPSCVIQMVLQPFPTVFRDRSAERGGNMFGLEQIKEDAVLLVAVVEGSAPNFYENAFPIHKAAIQEVQDFAKSVDGDSGFTYLNYANGSQNPLSTYGSANIKKMQDAAAKYDPTGIFQKRVPGGFKISKVHETI